MSGPAAKKQRTHPQYELLYHPGIPGRGEFIRLAFEAAGVSYTDTANEKENGYNEVLKVINQHNIGGDDEGNPPVFAPPALRVPGAGKDGKALLIHQTPVILSYIGPRIGLTPDDEVSQLHISQLAHTALDLCNEVHDTHHPIATSLYYEDQKEEALKKAKDIRENRLPKFLSYFERVLAGNKLTGDGKYLVGDQISYADTTLWQVIDGCWFAFPGEMALLRRSYPTVLEQFYEQLKEEKGIKEYLASDRRLPYSSGIFRRYPELDIPEGGDGKKS